MNTVSILIIGIGTVGHNLYAELISKGNHNLIIHCYDKYKGINNRGLGHYDLAFICVDTPADESSICDISEIAAAISDTDASIFVIKSTLLPDQAQLLKDIAPKDKHIVFSPEYYGATQHCNNFDFDFTILGGDKSDCIKVQQILQYVYDARHRFILTDIKTASLAKYMENAYLAMKVSFCNQFFDIAEKIGVNYEELRELFILDPRVNPSHTFVYRDHPYWDSHCLNKDVRAIAEEYDACLLKDLITFNESRKHKEE